jgi:chemotaxis protein methyltransferase CheR
MTTDKQVITDIDIADLKKIASLVYSKYGYDFRDYAMSSFKRRVLRIIQMNEFTVETLLDSLTDRLGYITEFLEEITVNTTEFFRDPGFWRLIRQEIIPAIQLNNKQFRIMHAGCSSGEEVLSMAILLHEMGIADDVSLTATDIDHAILEKARSATYSIKSMELNNKNYVRFEGKHTLEQYYTAQNGKAVFDRQLLRKVDFRKYDLVTGEVFNKFDLVLCRNVMIYFNQKLQNEVLKKLHASLFTYGYLCIGNKESVTWCDCASRFITVNQEEKIFRKIRD